MAAPMRTSQSLRRDAAKSPFIQSAWAAATRRSTSAWSISMHRDESTPATSLRSRPCCKRAAHVRLKSKSSCSMAWTIKRARRRQSQAEGQIKPPGEVVDSQKVEVKNDGTLTGIRFELEPDSVGRRRLAVRVVAPSEDRNQRDDLRDARYEVVSRKLRVMAVAGGPTREYRFVRNLLFREKSVELDAWLQTGQPGISQDADRVLDGFPTTAEALFEYDAIAMFDPDWTCDQCRPTRICLIAG